MIDPKFDLAHIINRFGKHFVQRYKPNAYILHTLNAITKCRTAELGGHTLVCDCCGAIHFRYNSCRNRHCPQCQAAKQAFWVDDLMHSTLPVKHYHIVFTVPHELNDICLLNSADFYNRLFSCAWESIRCAGYTHFGVETGAVCVLHSWGQDLCLHPHIHCIVPAAGLTLAGKWNHVGKNGKYLFPVTRLSVDFRSHFLGGLKRWLIKRKLLKRYQYVIDKAWKKDWNVHAEPSMASPEHVIRYLGNYTLRVAISNSRILNVCDTKVTFRHKDYANNAKVLPISLDGVEFLRRFCMHILPKRFVKIRRFGVYSSRYKALTNKLMPKTPEIMLREKETYLERLIRVTGVDVSSCPSCKTGRLLRLEELPRIRAPANFFYASFCD